ncbi:MAG: hypothetical protein ACYT04_47210 [Nostoc sp.]
MADPLTTLTASAITALAFQEFVKSGAGELAKKFTTSAIAKISELRKKIWDRLHGKYDKAQELLPKAETGDKQAIDTIAKLLDVEMLDPEFAADIQVMVQEINAGKLLDNSNMTQNNHDNSTGYQTRVETEKGTTNIGGTHTHYHP